MNLTPFKKITPCILSFNRRDDLRFTLQKLLAWGDIWAKIIVADNNSEDGTQEMLANEFPDVVCLSTGGNVGVSGWNVAFEDVDSEWALSLDDDSHPVLETWDPICSALEEDVDVAAIALSICGAESCKVNQEKRPLTPTCSFSSAGVLLRKDALDVIGGYNPDLFLFTNEIDWAARAVSQGYKLLMCDCAQVVHRSTPLQRNSWRHAYYYCRNLFLWIMRYAPESVLQDLLSRYIRDVYLFSLLHCTRYYLKAYAEGKQLYKALPTVPRLTLEAFERFRIDYRMPFAYFG